jgi:hypothetical protein
VARAQQRPLPVIGYLNGKDIPTNKCYDYGGCCRGVIL